MNSKKKAPFSSYSQNGLYLYQKHILLAPSWWWLQRALYHYVSPEWNANKSCQRNVQLLSGQKWMSERNKQFQHVSHLCNWYRMWASGFHWPHNISWKWTNRFDNIDLGWLPEGGPFGNLKRKKKLERKKIRIEYTKNKLKSSLYLRMYVNERHLDLAFIRLWTES